MTEHYNELWGQNLPKSSPVDLMEFVSQKSSSETLQTNGESNGNGQEQNASPEKEGQGQKEKEVVPLSLSDIVEKNSLSKDSEKNEGEVPSTEEPKTEEAKEASSEQKTEEPPPVKPLKIFDLKIGEEQIEVPEDAVLEVTVDGKKEKVTLKEFASGISGSKAIEKRFADFGKEKGLFQREKDTYLKEKQLVESTFKGARDLIQQNNPFKAMVDLLPKIAGINPAEVQRAIITQAKALTQELSNYSEEEITRAVHEEGLKFQKATIDQEKTALQLEKSKIELDKYVSANQAKYGITDELFSAAWAVMKEKGYEKTAVNKSGKEIADDVFKFILDESKNVRITSVIERVDSKIAKDKSFVDTVTALVNQAFPEGDVTEQDLQEIIEGILGAPKKETTVATPKQEPKKEALATPSPASPPREERKVERKEPILRFEDIIDRYR